MSEQFLRFKFDSKKDWKFTDPKKVSPFLERRILNENNAIYYEWVKKIVNMSIEGSSKLFLRKKFIRDMVIDTDAISMSEKNIDILRICLDTVSFGEYRPSTDSTLCDDEIKIDTNRIIGERK